MTSDVFGVFLTYLPTLITKGEWWVQKFGRAVQCGALDVGLYNHQKAKQASRLYRLLLLLL